MELVSIVVVVLIVFAVGQYLMQNFSSGKEKERHAEKPTEQKVDSTTPTQEPEKLPYKRHDYLMNVPERKFYEFLYGILPSGYLALPQVLLSKIVSVYGVNKREKGSRYNTRWSKINKKTIDFVVFSKPNYQPVVCVEYDGKTHDKPSRQKRDIEVANILSECGMDLIHIRHGKTTPKEAKEKILAYLS